MPSGFFPVFLRPSLYSHWVLRWLMFFFTEASQRRRRFQRCQQRFQTCQNYSKRLSTIFENCYSFCWHLPVDMCRAWFDFRLRSDLKSTTATRKKSMLMCVTVRNGLPKDFQNGGEGEKHDYRVCSKTLENHSSVAACHIETT